jgi:Tol biopolymer transport system component
MRPGSSERLRLTPPHPVREAAWSVDGRYLAHVRDGDVFVANADGSGERNLTRGDANQLNANPAWSPDGRRLAFTELGFQGSSRIGLVERTGSNRRFLNLGVPGNLSQPAWAPNGRQLALVSSSKIPPTRDLYIAEIDGSRSQLLARGAGEPAWSPDGARIAYVGVSGLVVANADGTGSRSVAVGASSPAWSPDGRLIAFVRDGVLFTTRPDGSGKRVVVNGPLPVLDPAWRAAAAQPGGARRPCVLAGSPKADAIRGTAAAEVVVGGAGADTIFGGGGHDVVLGGSGDDFLSGEAGGDRLVGGAGRDRIYGGRGDDVLHGLDAERDLLDGGRGRDQASSDVGLTDGAGDRLRSVESLSGP